MPIKLITSGGGSAILTPTTNATDYTLTVPAVTANVITSADSNTVTGTMIAQNSLTASKIYGAQLTSMTAQASTSGTTISFTGIPSWAKRISFMLNGVSTNGTSLYILQLGYGDTPTWVTSGYTGAAQYGSSAYYTSSSNAAGIYIMGYNEAGCLHSGLSTITLLDASTNTWVASGVIGESTSTVPTQHHGWSVALSGTLTAVRINTVSGTNTFDAGKINIMYE